MGGVGSVCLECLYRSGVRHITIVDGDCYDESNQNRQLYSEHHVGAVKVEALKEHFPEVSTIHKHIDEAWIKSFDFEPYDVVLDAIDDFKAKVTLPLYCHKRLISATGSAKRIDPTQVQVASIWKSHGDKLASKLRYELKKRRFSKKYTCIFSAEPPRIKEKGSFMAVTGAFGLTLCSQAIKRIIER